MSVFTIKSVTGNAPQNAPKLAVGKWESERNYYSGNDASGKSHLNYMKQGTPLIESVGQAKERTFGIFDQDGTLTEKREQVLRQNLKSTKSHIWTGVINFERDKGIKHCSTIEQAQAGFTKVFSEFCKEADIDKKNLNYVVSLHENSDLYHLHYMFFEKKPKRISNVKSELCYSKKFVVDKNAVLKMPEMIDRAFDGLLQENTMKTEALKKLAKERVREFNFTADLKTVAKMLKTETEMNLYAPYEKWYSTLSKKSKLAVDKMTAKVIKSKGVKSYTDELLKIPKEERKDFRAKVYNDIGLRVIRGGMDCNAIDYEKESRLKKLTQERKAYDLKKGEQITFRRIKKVAKINLERVAEEVKEIDIVQIMRKGSREIMTQHTETLRRKL